MLLLLAVIFFCCYISSLAFTCTKYHRYPTCIYDNNIEKSLENARKNIIERKSPGAGLATAGVCLFIYTKYHTYSISITDEQADAAYADLINTTMEQRGIENLSSEELEQLDKGGTMYVISYLFISYFT